MLLVNTHLVPTAKSPAPEPKEYELSSSEEFVDKEFDKKEFLLRFQVSMTQAMSTAMSEVISKLLEQPAKTCRNKQRRKNLCEREAKHLADDTGTGSIIKQSRPASQCSRNTENVICHLVRSDSEVSEWIRRKIRTEAEHWTAIEKDAAQWKHWAIQISQEVAEAELQEAYLQKKEPDKIQAATHRARVANYELKKIQQLEAAGLTSSSPNNPHYMKVLNRWNPITDVRPAPAGQTLASTINVLRLCPYINQSWISNVSDDWCYWWCQRWLVMSAMVGDGQSLNGLWLQLWCCAYNRYDLVFQRIEEGR